MQCHRPKHMTPSAPLCSNKCWGLGVCCGWPPIVGCSLCGRTPPHCTEKGRRKALSNSRSCPSAPGNNSISRTQTCLAYIGSALGRSGGGGGQPPVSCPIHGPGSALYYSFEGRWIKGRPMFRWYNVSKWFSAWPTPDKETASECRDDVREEWVRNWEREGERKSGNATSCGPKKILERGLLR